MLFREDPYFKLAAGLDNATEPYVTHSSILGRFGYLKPAVQLERYAIHNFHS